VSLWPVLSPSNTGWNHKIEPFALPPLTRIVLADVDAGSDTPSLVGRVLRWRREHAQEGTSTRALMFSLDLSGSACVTITTSPFAHGRSGSDDSGPPVVRPAKCKCRSGIGRKKLARSLSRPSRSVCRRRSDRRGFLRETCTFSSVFFLMPDLTRSVDPGPSGCPTAPRS